MRFHSLFLPVLLVACSQVPVANTTAPAASAAVGFSNPRTRHEWLAMRWRDENGNLPTPAQRAAARAQFRTVDATWDGIDDPNLQRTSWVPHGPDNIGGRSRCLVIHPTRPYRMWSGSVGGGVWRSDTYGSNWQKLDDFPGNLAIGCLALDPSNPDVLYAGTGEGFGNIDAILGEGIWKSTDGGDSWTLLTATAAFGNVNRLAISPTSPNTIVAATTTGVQRSTDGGTTWATRIAGVSAWQVLFDPNNGNRCIASMSDTTNASVRFSNDAGNTWTTTTYVNGNGRIELAYAKATASRLFASVDIGSGQLWRSNDGGNVWTQMTATNLSQSPSQTWYNNCIWVDPTDSQRIVVGWTSVYRSTDGGATFTVVANGGGYTIDEELPHADHHAIVADPGYDGVANRTVYVCNDGGVYRTSDITTCTTSSGWSKRKDSLVTSQFYGVAGHGGGKLIGGMQDNGTAAITTTNPHAVRLIGGDGGPCAVDPVEPSRTYGQVQYRSVYRHDGVAEASISNGLEVGQGSCNNFICPLELDPHDRRRLYSGGCSLWRTVDATATSVAWTSVKPSTGSPISAIAISPMSADIVWVGHNNGAVFRTANATAANPTWVTVDDGANVGSLPNSAVTDLAIHRTNPGEVWVTFGGFVAGNVQRTTNNGTSWTAMQGLGGTALPNAPMLTIVQHPLRAGSFYVGSEVGVFDTHDSGATWSTTNEGPADVACYDLTFIPGTTTLLAGTHGRGIWSAELSEPGARNLGIGCPGSNGTPFLSATPPRLGQSSTVTLNGPVFNQPVFLLQGLSKWSWFGNRLPFDMAPFGAPGCELRISPDIVREWSLAAQGTLQTQMPIGSNPALVGQQFYLQAVVVDPAANAWGNTLSNAVHMTIDV
jgi:hypothetical protein